MDFTKLNQDSESSNLESLLQEVATPTTDKDTTTIETQEVKSDFVEPVNIEPETEKETIDKLDPSTSAEIYIGIMDNLQQFLFTSIQTRKTAKKIGSKEALETAEKKLELLEVGKVNDFDLQDEELHHVNILKKAKKKFDKIPFSDDERESLREPLAKVIGEAGYDLPPNLALTLIVAQVFIPRLSDAFFD